MLLLNASLVGCILSLGVLLVLSIQGAAALVPHVAFLLFLAVGLLFLINWCALCYNALCCMHARICSVHLQCLARSSHHLLFLTNGACPNTAALSPLSASTLNI